MVLIILSKLFCEFSRLWKALWSWIRPKQERNKGSCVDFDI